MSTEKETESERPMEKRNVATGRRAVEDDEDEVRREASLFGGVPEKRAGSRDPAPSEEDERSDEDTLR